MGWNLIINIILIFWEHNFENKIKYVEIKFSKKSKSLDLINFSSVDILKLHQCNKREEGGGDLLPARASCTVQL